MNSIDDSHFSSCGQVILTISLLASLHFRQTKNYTQQQRQNKTERDFHYYNTRLEGIKEGIFFLIFYNLSTGFEQSSHSELIYPCRLSKNDLFSLITLENGAKRSLISALYRIIQSFSAFFIKFQHFSCFCYKVSQILQNLNQKPEVNFTNILRAAFSNLFFSKKCKYRRAANSTFVQKKVCRQIDTSFFRCFFC